MIFHKDLNFPKEHDKALDIYASIISARQKSKSLIWSNHAKTRLLERNADIKEFYAFYNDIEFLKDNIIEYTLECGEIEKALFRFSYNRETDCIISLSKWGKIVTIYFNDTGDNHKTLNKKVYQNAVTC